ncbi:MAG: hypothetical protein ACRYGF_16230 [Janthinobacterium lividum]
MYRERYLSDYYAIGEHAVHPKSGPYAYIIPVEQTESAATARLVNILITGANEVEQAKGDFSADGKQYRQGSYIVKLAQPYGAFAKSLLESRITRTFLNILAAHCSGHTMSRRRRCRCCSV